jgi:hypothetical protein
VVSSTTTPGQRVTSLVADRPGDLDGLSRGRRAGITKARANVANRQMSRGIAVGSQ